MEQTRSGSLEKTEVQDYKDSSGLKGCLPFTWKNQKFWLGNQMVRIIPFETFKKL